MDKIKKLLLVLLLLCLHIVINAQNLVDTLLHNKNVILEEFTGIHCSLLPIISVLMVTLWLNQYMVHILNGYL